MPFGQLGTPNLTPSTILCVVVQGINSITPLGLAGQAATAEARTAWASEKLGLVGLSGTILGCPTGALSPNAPIYPNASSQGGPLNPPPSVAANTGNNVYNRTYFAGTAPTTPRCNHVS